MRRIKKTLAFLLALAVLLSASSCALVRSDLEQMQDTFMDVMEKIQSADREGILSLLSREAKELADVENQVDGLISYVSGMMMSSFTRYANTSFSEDSELKEYRYCYQFSTTGGAYRMYIYEIAGAKGMPEREGIFSIYVIRREEDISNGEYRGDGMDTPGIHIGLVEWEAEK